MNDLHLHEGLERLSHDAPQVDATGMARVATTLAVRSRRRRLALALPGVAAAAAVVVVATQAGLQPAGRTDVASSSAPSAVGPSAAPSAAPSLPSGVAMASTPLMAYLVYDGWTCCDDADRSELVRPGGGFLAHFRPVNMGLKESPARVTVVLTGPFADAKAMNADPPAAGGSRYISPPLTLPAVVAGTLVATVPIPAAAAPGLYLVSVVTADSTSSAGFVEITR